MAAVLLSSRVDDDSKAALHKRGRKKIQNIFLQPYQCSESRNTESPLQGVRGGESFRVIRSSGIPYPFWFLGALPNANFLVSISFSITLGIQDQIDITIFHIFVSSWCIFVFSAPRSFTEYSRSATHTTRGISFRYKAGKVSAFALTSAGCQLAVSFSRVDDDPKPALRKRGRN